MGAVTGRGERMVTHSRGGFRTKPRLPAIEARDKGADDRSPTMSNDRLTLPDKSNSCCRLCLCFCFVHKVVTTLVTFSQVNSSTSVLAPPTPPPNLPAPLYQSCPVFAPPGVPFLQPGKKSLPVLGSVSHNPAPSPVFASSPVTSSPACSLPFLYF